MNRNTESHFSNLPAVDIQRSMFNRSSSHKTSFNVGELIPLYVDEILPGDTVQMNTSKVVRLQTLLTPIMDNMYLDTYWFFVPNRLVWEHWQQFCGENTSSAWTPVTQYTMPKLKSPVGGFPVGSLADYMGLPVNKEFRNNVHPSVLPSSLPFRAYALICDQFFRDENLTDPLNIPFDDSTIQGEKPGASSYITNTVKGGSPFKVAKYHDYFTSCLPSPQKGNPVKVPVDVFSGLAPVYAHYSKFHNPLYPDPDETRLSSIVTSDEASTSEGLHTLKRNKTTNVVENVTYPNYDTNLQRISPINLWADIPQPNVTGIAINDLRMAFQLQKFYERNARGGTRYIELLKSHFGVTSPDARLQRAEYLGGNRVPVQIHQVTNSAQSEQDFLGDLGAMSVTSDYNADFVKSFVEHGILMCVGCVRYDHTYSQGMDRMWTRNNFTDFYLPVFANIGEQPVYSSELFYDPSTLADPNTRPVFGYQEAWAEYRYKPSRVSSEMRPEAPHSLASWHLSDNYSTTPTLSDGWIREDKNIVNRVLAVSSSVSNQVFADYYFDAVYTRPMPMYSIPGLIDHN